MESLPSPGPIIHQEQPKSSTTITKDNGGPPGATKAHSKLTVLKSGT